jgi:hypothetical protein
MADEKGRLDEGEEETGVAAEPEGGKRALEN